jgi:D-tagatose-1,6-bisphosphate aldolase subunit GatZ/KbaZ
MRLMCHYSLSDRIRHCWIAPQVEATVCWLLVALRDQIVPLPLMWQHMQHAARSTGNARKPQNILIERVQDSLSTYNAACRPTNATSHIEDLTL